MAADTHWTAVASLIYIPDIWNIASVDSVLKYFLKYTKQICYESSVIKDIFLPWSYYFELMQV